MFKVALLPQEKVLAVYRQTEAVLFKPVLIVFVLIYFPWYFLLKYDLAANYVRLLFFWTLLVLLYAANKYVIWLLNTHILTDRRLVSVRYRNMLNKQVMESPLDRILNISFKVAGFWQAMFSFGDVEVQVAGLPQPLLMKNISKPNEVKDFLWQVHGRYAKTGPLSGSPTQAQDVFEHGRIH